MTSPACLPEFQFQLPLDADTCRNDGVARAVALVWLEPSSLRD